MLFALLQRKSLDDTPTLNRIIIATARVRLCQHVCNASAACTVEPKRARVRVCVWGGPAPGRDEWREHEHE